MLPYPVLVLGDVKVYMYGIMIAIGILACFWVLFEYTKRLGFSAKETDFIFYDGIIAIVFGFLGAALWQSTFNYIADVKEYGIENATFVFGSGLTVIGGIITGSIAFIIGMVLRLIYKRNRGEKHSYLLTRIIVIAPCCITVAHAFGRLGCFFAGCCYGKEASGFFSFLGVSFPAGSLYGGYDGTPVYPTQLFEAAYLFVLFGVLSYLALKKNFKYNLPVYMIAYSVWRFLIEFVRGDDRGAFVGGLYPSQTQSLALIAVAVGAIFLIRELNKRLQAEKVAEPDCADCEVLGEEQTAEEVTSSRGDEQ